MNSVRQGDGDEDKLPQYSTVFAPLAGRNAAVSDNAGAPESVPAYGCDARFSASAWLLRCATKRDPATDCPRLPRPHAAALPCALWVVNQLNDKLGSIFALIVIVIIGVVHVQLSDDGAHPLIGVPCILPGLATFTPPNSPPI